MGMTAENLRNSILQYAIEGRLVPQNPTDTPASVLLQEIVSERNKLERQKQIKKVPHATIYKGTDGCYYEKREDGTSKCIEDDIPFKIPQSWEWVRLIDICSVLNGDRGKNYPSKSKLSSSGIPFISALNLDGKSVVSDDKLLCVSEEQYNKLGNGKLRKDDIVVCIRGSLGKHGKYPFERGAIASSLVILRPYVNNVLSSYIMFYLDTPLFFQEIRKYDNGTAQPNLAAKNLEQFFVPIPPLSEQERIVEKIDEYELLLGEYECLEDELTVLDENIHDKLWKSILQYAIEGKLVPQNPNDEDASVLMQRIVTERKYTTKKSLSDEIYIKSDGHIYERTGKEEKDITNETTFDLPQGWMYIRLSHIAELSSGFTPKEDELASIGEVPYFKVADMNTTGNEKYLTVTSKYYVGTKTKKIFKKGTIVFPKNGGAVFTNKKRILSKDSVVDLNTGAITPSKYVNLDYFYYLFCTIDFRRYFKGTALPTVNDKFMNSLLLALPPYTEQERIVGEIEKYKLLLDRLFTPNVIEK